MYYTEEELDKLLQKVREIVRGERGREEKLQAVCDLLEHSISYYDWVGFYIADEKERELTLGPYVGEPTEHTRISFGQGICGQAAEIKKPFIVQDVRKETNYLSCSVKVMSEIVLPILKQNRIVGELDIDSHTISPFTDKDTRLLESVCQIVAEIF